jgi:phosphoglycolate phosphatase
MMLQLTDPITWYIGDAKRDIEAANAAKMFSVVAEYGYIKDMRDIQHWQADLNIACPTKLLDFL